MSKMERTSSVKRQCILCHGDSEGIYSSFSDPQNVTFLGGDFYIRYAYSEEANEDFDKDDTTLTLIKPSPTPSKDFQSAPEARSVQGSSGASNGDLEEDKTK